MKRKLLLSACAVCLLFFSVSCTAKSKTTICVNPLTYTDIPDNDWIRVGNDYYMVSTTMYFCPGVPIMHSKDLVHWEIVSYVCDFIEDDDVYNLRNGRNAYGKGQWATSLRYENGTYYALFIANDQAKTYIYRTKDITKSNWERSVIDRPFHDASMLFEDGHLFSICVPRVPIYITLAITTIFLRLTGQAVAYVPRQPGVPRICLVPMSVRLFLAVLLTVVATVLPKAVSLRPRTVTGTQ